MFKIKKIMLTFAIIPFILFMITACAELDSHSSLSRFQSAEDLYISSMRWGEWSSYLYLIRAKPTKKQTGKIITLTDPNTGNKYEVVETQVDSNNATDAQQSSNDKTTEREELLLHLDTIKVSHVEVLSSSLNEEKGTAKSRMLIEYHHDNSAKIKTLHYNVFWWHDETSNSWFSQTPMPKEFEPPKHKTIKLSPKRY
ncbi:MAG: hypothetical protein OQL19_08655 [Gammaproteobacteria bacterium]|nr:hypothetical protein [Gammaproteobacteria bacterium]